MTPTLSIESTLSSLNLKYEVITDEVWLVSSEEGEEVWLLGNPSQLAKKATVSAVIINKVYF